MIDRIDHIGIAVHSIEEAAPLYEETFGLVFEGEEEVTSQGVKVAFFSAGETMIELLEPLDEEGPIARFLERRGPGVHHIALGCEDIEETRETMESRSIRLLSEAPRVGAHNKLISFMHPGDTGRVLFELTQKQDSHQPS